LGTTGATRDCDTTVGELSTEPVSRIGERVEQFSIPDLPISTWDFWRCVHPHLRLANNIELNYLVG